MSEFGSEVGRLLSERGMSLHQAARLTHYDVSYLSKVVNGHKPGSAARPRPSMSCSVRTAR